MLETRSAVLWEDTAWGRATLLTFGGMKSQLIDS